MKASDTQVGGRHYKDMVIQPAEFCQRNRLNWCEANVVKYICRHADKKGAEDLQKAKHYIDLLLEWEYPASEGLPAERKASLCHSCHVGACSSECITRCEETGKCDWYAPALRENMLDAKQEAPKFSPCPTCRHTCPAWEVTRAGQLGECPNFYPTAKQEAPTSAVPPTTHTDPSTNCKDCHNTACVGKGRDLTCDQGCERFIPKAVAVDLHELPSFALDCTMDGAWGKWQEELSEFLAATPYSMDAIVERWDCLQALQTHRECGGHSPETYAKVATDLSLMHKGGLPVVEAKARMLLKNAKRGYYAPEVNTAIISSNGHSFTPEGA